MFCLGPAWPVTLAGTALAGLGGALLVMVMPGLISDHHGEHRATAFAAVNGAPGLAGVGFSLLVGAALALHWSWRSPYLILTAIIVTTLTIVAWPVRVPESNRHGTFTLSHLRDRDVLKPWLHVINAVFSEFAIGLWAATYLKEVGHASGGLAAALAGVFGVMMFVSRTVMPSIVRVFGDATVAVSFVVTGFGAMVMCFAPGLAPRVLGLIIVGFGGAPLYPLTVDRLYALGGVQDRLGVTRRDLHPCFRHRGHTRPAGDGRAGRLGRPAVRAADRAAGVRRRRDHATAGVDRPHRRSSSGLSRRLTRGEIQSAAWAHPSH